MRLAVLLGFALILVGCFTVNPVDGAVKCDVGGNCPTGYYCTGGACWQDGHLPPDDLGVTNSPDLTSSSSPDMVSPCGDTQSDAQNCGTCGHDCTKLPHVTGQGVVCTAGKCVVPLSACATGFTHCSTNVDDGCEVDLSQPAHCGSCTNACAVSAPLCSGSGSTFTCTVMCSSPTPDRCTSQCVNLNSDPNNCKTCGTACTFANASATCSTGTCAIGACNTGYKDCKNGPADGCETYVMGSDKTNCGDCGNACSFANAAASCATGVCQLGACNFGYADCKNGAADGCETNTQNDPMNCNACNAKCGLTESCATAACGKTTPTCGAGCDATCVLVGQFSADASVAVDYTHNKLIWQVGTLVAQSFDQAKLSCAGLNLDGLTSWRLPTIAEWGQIAVKCGGLNAGHPGTCTPCIDQAAFPPASNVAQGYWSSDTNGGTPGVNLLIHAFSTFDGRQSNADPTAAVPVKCVHDPI